MDFNFYSFNFAQCIIQKLHIGEYKEYSFNPYSSISIGSGFLLIVFNPIFLLQNHFLLCILLYIIYIFIIYTYYLYIKCIAKGYDESNIGFRIFAKGKTLLILHYVNIKFNIYILLNIAIQLYNNKI